MMNKKTQPASILLVTSCLLLACNYALAGKGKAKDEINGFTYKLGAYEGVFSNDGTRETDYYLRRAEVSADGQFTKSLNYEVKLKADYEGSITLREAFLSYELPYKSEIVAGRFDPDFGLELTGSSSWTTANERSSIWDLVKNAGDGSDGEGLALRTAHKHYFVSVGGFRFSDNHVLNLRAAYMPLNNNDQTLHLGYSARNAIYDNPEGGVIRTDLSMWGVHVNDNGNSIRLARDSRNSGFDDDVTQVLELAYAQGPFSIQGEHLLRKFNGAHHEEDRDAKGDYLQLAYTLTGETRNYNTKSATFGKIKPNSHYGAWEIFYRYDQVETNGEAGMLSQGRTHGEATSKVMGVNWYVLDYLKISVNYIDGNAPLIPNDADNEKGKALSLQAQLKF
jgi:phosphate-selective porin OprO and OprP